MIRFCIFIGLLLAPGLPGFSQTIRFQLIRNGKILGECEANKQCIDGREVYANTTSFSFYLIKKIKLEYRTQAIFRKGFLEKAEVEIKRNGRLHRHFKTQRINEETYRYYQDRQLKKVIETPIVYSSVKMLFEEPIDGQEIYSEEGGCFLPVHKIGPSAYEKRNAKGKVNTYEYQNRLLQSIAIDNGIIELAIILKK